MQAAACTTLPRCLPFKGKGIRTGGRLHPGPAGERLLNNAHCWIVSVLLLWLRVRVGLWRCVGFVLDVTYQECDERHLSMSTSGSTLQLARTPGCTLWLSVGVRTGGRLRPGLAGSDCLNNALSPSRAGFGGLVVVGPSAKSNLGTEVFCVLACPPVPPLLGVLLLAFVFLVLARLSRTVHLPFCVLAALGGFAPGLGPLAFSLHDPGHPV